MIFHTFKMLFTWRTSKSFWQGKVVMLWTFHLLVEKPTCIEVNKSQQLAKLSLSMTRDVEIFFFYNIKKKGRKKWGRMWLWFSSLFFFNHRKTQLRNLDSKPWISHTNHLWFYHLNWASRATEHCLFLSAFLIGRLLFKSKRL